MKSSSVHINISQRNEFFPFAKIDILLSEKKILREENFELVSEPESLFWSSFVVEIRLNCLTEVIK